MANNLIIAYDLLPPGQNYEAVRERIRSLGRWYQLQYSLFYVQTAVSIDFAYNQVRSAMDLGDKLAVILASGMVVGHHPPTDLDAIEAVWNSA